MVYKNRTPPPIPSSTPFIADQRRRRRRSRLDRKLWLSTVGGCVILVNSTYNLSYLSPFCSSYLPSPAFPPPMSCLSLSLSPTFSLTSYFLFFRLIHTQPHSHALAYFTFLCRLFSSSSSSSASSSFVWSERLYIFTGILLVVV